MVKKSISIDEKLYSEIKEYCKLNGLKLNEFVESLLRKTFTLEKFGDVPFGKVDEEPEHIVVKTKLINPIDHITVNAKLTPDGELQILDDMKKADEEMQEIAKNTENLEEVQKDIDNLVFENKPKKVIRLN